jgi:hypothetical protein
MQPFGRPGNGTIDYWRAISWVRHNLFMRQRQLGFFSGSELAAMRDPMKARSYCLSKEEFRRDHRRRRQWGLKRRYGLKQCRAGGCSPTCGELGLHDSTDAHPPMVWPAGATKARPSTPAPAPVTAPARVAAPVAVAAPAPARVAAPASVAVAAPAPIAASALVAAPGSVAAEGPVDVQTPTPPEVPAPAASPSATDNSAFSSAATAADQNADTASRSHSTRRRSTIRDLMQKLAPAYYTRGANRRPRHPAKNRPRHPAKNRPRSRENAGRQKYAPEGTAENRGKASGVPRN